MKYNSSVEMYHDQLRVIYGTEYNCITIYTSLGTAATDPMLSAELVALLDDSKEYLTQLGEIFQNIGLTAQGEPGECFDSLALDCEDIMRKTKQPMICDIALIMMLLRISQYKIVGYDIAKHWAVVVGSDVASGVYQSLQERNQTAHTRIERIAAAVCSRRLNGLPKRESHVSV